MNELLSHANRQHPHSARSFASKKAKKASRIFRRSETLTNRSLTTKPEKKKKEIDCG